MAVEDAQYPFVSLSELDEPPGTWQQVRRRETELNLGLGLNELHALSEYHTCGFRCQKIFRRKQDYVDLLHKILYYTQTGLGNEAAFTERVIICAGPVGPGTLAEDVRSARGWPTWYLTQQVALERIQPHQSLRSACADIKSRPRARNLCYDIAPETPVYSHSNGMSSDCAQQPILPADARAPKSPRSVEGPQVLGKLTRSWNLLKSF